MLSIKLEQSIGGGVKTEDGTQTSTKVDAEGYLTGLDSMVLKSDAEIG